MADEGRRTKSKRKPKPRLRLFYLNDMPYRVLQISRPQDLVVAWSYLEKKRQTFIYSDALRRHEPCWTTGQVAAILDRNAFRIQQYLWAGVIPTPFKTYSILTMKDNGSSSYMWREKDIFALHDYLLTVHKGRPRHDNRVTVMSSTPSRAEIRAKMKNETTFYVKNADGEFVKVWKEPEW